MPLQILSSIYSFPSHFVIICNFLVDRLPPPPPPLLPPRLTCTSAVRKLLYTSQDPVSVSKGGDSNALQVLMGHVHQHVHRDMLTVEDLVEVV